MGRKKKRADTVHKEIKSFFLYKRNIRILTTKKIYQQKKKVKISTKHLKSSFITGMVYLDPTQ